MIAIIDCGIGDLALVRGAFLRIGVHADSQHSLATIRGAETARSAIFHMQNLNSSMLRFVSTAICYPNLR